MNRRKGLAIAAATVGLATVMLAVGAITGPINWSSPTSALTRTIAAPPADVLSPTDAASNIRALQTRLKILPNDWSAWSNLGAFYTAQARLTADPSYYTKADGAFARSLEVRPQDNASALSGKATLAASRHDFAGAYALTLASQKIDSFNATTSG